MRKIYLIPLLLLLTVAAMGAVIEVPEAPAWMTLIAGGGTPVEPGGGCDSCDGDLALAHHFENIDCESGTPCGCSDNGTKSITLGTAASISSQAFTGWPSDGSNSLQLGSTATTIPVSLDVGEGTLVFDFIADDLPTGAYNLLSAGTCNGDCLRVELYGTGDGQYLSFAYRGADGTACIATTAAWGMSADTVYTVTVKWDTTSAHSTHYCWVSNGASTSGSATQPTEISGGASTISVLDGNSSNIYIDNLKVYTTWQ